MDALKLSQAIGIPFARAQSWLDPLGHAMDRFGIDTGKRQAAFLAQVAHESALLTQIVENLNYSARALIGLFPKHFTNEEAEAYARHPEMIANRVYANRFGNGDETSGDGFRYRGRGLIQVTFHDNYQACGNALGIDLVNYPALLVQSENAALSAAWYWHKHDCNALADAGDIRGITRAINGGYNGLEERQALYDKSCAVLA